MSDEITNIDPASTNNDANIQFSTPVTTVSDVALSETSNIEFEKYKMKLNLFKWLIGTIGIAIITLIINWGFKDRAVGMDEISQYDRYATDIIILNDNPVKKRMLAQFFSTVTPSNKLKDGWKEYYAEVNKDYIKFIKSDSLIALKYKNMKKDTATMTVAEKIKYKEIVSQKKRYDSIKESPIVIPNKDISDIYPTMYIQYSNKTNKNSVTVLQQLLSNNGWKAPGIEYKEKGCDNSIRYFYDEDRAMANIANTLLGNKFEIKKVKGLVPKGQLEIWINN